MNLDFLKELGLSDLNSGTSTGATWGKQDEASQIISSLSPVDGKEIGQVYSTSPEAYENVVEAAEDEGHMVKYRPDRLLALRAFCRCTRAAGATSQRATIPRVEGSQETIATQRRDTVTSVPRGLECHECRNRSAIAALIAATG